MCTDSSDSLRRVTAAAFFFVHGFVDEVTASLAAENSKLLFLNVVR